MNPAMGFPMEMDQFPGKVWVVSHKPVAVAAGLGMMGIHRNVIHPKFGNFILLGTILLDADVSSVAGRSTTTPAWSANCASPPARSGRSRPTAISTSRPATRTTTGSSWAASPTGSSRSPTASDARDYRRRVSDAESASMWQSLSFGANYKAAYCLAVCPAGEDVIAPFLADRKAHLKEVVRPLKRRKRRFTSRRTPTPRTTSPGGSRTRGQARGQQPAAQAALSFSLRAATRVPAWQVGGVERHVPLYLHRR